MSNVTRETPVLPPVVPTPRKVTPTPSDEIDLVAYGATLWRYRYLLLIIGLIVTVATYTINRRMTPTYESRFRLMGSETGLEDTPRTTRLNIVAFRELVESPTLAAGLLTEFGLSGPPHNLTPEKFLAANVDVEVIRDSTIIEVAVRLKDKEKVVQLGRRYAERVVETAQRLNTEGIDYTAEKIKHERDASLERLNGFERLLEDYQRKAQIELLRKDVDTLLERRPDALDLTVRIQGARARLQQAETELGRQDKVRDVRRGVDSVGTMAGQDKAENKSEALRIRGELLDPYVNPVYEALSRDVGEYRAQLAGLEQERKALVGRLQLDSPTADKLTRLYAAEAQLEVLGRNREIARAAYLTAAKQYEDARLQSTIRSPRLQILDAALAADAPVAPRAARNTLAATLLALSLAAAAVIAFDAARERTA
ncbi:MAG: hypothetical protein H0W08_02500 [Acidobacteria bacterium]|nr:hypothetical protein [Acidobacteriota bacterium]